MKRLLLAALAAGLALANPASAMETLHIHCSNIVTTVGKYSVNPNDTIDIDWNWGYWNIGFSLASGQVLTRGTQYNIRDLSNNDHAEWAGDFYKHPQLHMVGELSVNGKALSYQETLFDTSRGNLVVMHQSAPCLITNLPPRQPQEASPAPAPTPSYPPPAPSTGPDMVGILSDGARAIVEVTLGSTKVAMLIDTGAVEMSLTPKVAQRLLNAGEAHYTGQTSTFTMANGTTSSEQEIVIDKLQIGVHTLYGVSASITTDDGGVLLPYSVLSKIGSFKIDTANNLLIFG